MRVISEMMLNGVPIPSDDLRRTRIIKYKKMKMQQEANKNIMLAQAALGQESQALKFMQRYIEDVFNMEESYKKSIEEHKDELEEHTKDELWIEDVLSPNE